MSVSDTVVTIDGPAGVGKSAVSRLVAAALGFSYLDTGAMYRAVALKITETATDFRNPGELRAVLGETTVGFAGAGRVLLDSRDVSDRIRTRSVSSLSSEIAALGEVRRFLVGVQRKIGGAGNIVAEGRDMGTRVFPDAGHKFYLDASPAERAKRRFLQSGRTSVEDVESELRERDRRDTLRERSPLYPAPDAVIIDTTRMELAEVVGEILLRTRGVSSGAGEK